MKLTPISYNQWSETKDTIQLFLQIVGKIKLRYSFRKNHWWHATYFPSLQGLTTNLFYIEKQPFEIRFNFFQHRLELFSAKNQWDFPLSNLCVKDFYEKLLNLFEHSGTKITIDYPHPYDCNSDIPFVEDTKHRIYNTEKINEWFANLLNAHYALQSLRQEYKTKLSPIHMFWHSFDLATTLFTGQLAPEMKGVDSVTQDAYSDELVSFGWWPGDHKSEAAAFYAYVHPSPNGINQVDLSPFGGSWVDRNGSPLAVLPNTNLIDLSFEQQQQQIKEFYQTVQKRGYELNQWDEENLYYEYK